MTQTAQDVMTRAPETVAPEAPLTEIAAIMRDAGTGMVPVTEGDKLCGVVTDRDIVIRAIADGLTPDTCSARDVWTDTPLTAAPGDDVGDVVRLMRDADVRRIPVVDGARVVGVISLGDLARERDPRSVLADISSAPADR